MQAYIQPFQALTDQYLYVYTNIDQTLDNVTKTLEIFSTTKTLDSKIRSGSQGDMEAYLTNVDSILDALTFISQNVSTIKNADKIHAQLKVLKQLALVECETSFSSLLAKNSHPLDPSKIPSPLPDKLDLVPVEDKQVVKALVERIEKLQSSRYVNSFVQNRAKFLLGTLRKLNLESLLAPSQTVTYTKGSHPFLHLISLFVKLLQGGCFSL
eukprot:TRINITY_DN13290_c0_g1_i1.p1 TRINITY_DN13290_c0_g1~~TRINITY_DN13290_c0_g1_i1.p1  ORF type:complete len:248 (+),score=49.07 TRINITY_DN13290_c0_g1_i1:110-745(+)